MAGKSEAARGAALDDTREIRKVSVDQLNIDPNVQRRTRDSRLDEMGPWDWSKAEMMTAGERADGSLVVIEGQNRALLLKRDYPGTKINVIVLPSPEDGYAAEEAAVARGIAGGRVSHSSFAKMDLEYKAGDPYWHAVVSLLAKHGMTLVDIGSAGPRSIVCVSTIRTLMHAFDKTAGNEAESIQQASDMLEGSIAVLQTAFEGHNQDGIWDRVLLQVVAGLLSRGAEPKRLTKILSRQSPQAWLAEVKRRRYRTSAVRFLAETILVDYNHALRGGKLEW